MSTQQQRERFSPACAGKGSFYIGAYQALNAVFERWNYHPRSGVTGAYNCRVITGGSGYSLHAYGPGERFSFFNGLTIATSLAVDVNWDRNPYSGRSQNRLVTDMPRDMVNAALAVRANNGERIWGWGGNYRNVKDSMHYEIVCSPAALRSGIRGQSVPSPSQPPPPRPPQQGDLDVNNLRVVRRGQEGWPVRVVQGLLVAGGIPVVVDGDFGPATDRAVRHYQSAHGLGIDGVVGPNTYGKLLAPIL